jgi:hypothetical protein
MKIKAIITGSTGMVGRGVLLECLESPEVESVLLVNRSPVGISHEKLTEIIHPDFYNLKPIADKLSGYNACFFCLGVSSAGMSEPDYTRVTYDLTLHFARTLLDKNLDMSFCYVSGTGTDSTEKGRVMWARVKGRTENDLLKMPFKNVWLFRPGLIQPLRGIKSRTKIYRIFYFFLTPFYPLLKLLSPSSLTTTARVGKAMINIALKGYFKKHLENKDINLLASGK